MISVIILVLNIFDALVHVATNQVELLRISSNIVIIFVALLMLLSISKSYILQLAALGLYLLLNIIFIVNNGIGTAGVIFILLTTLLTSFNIFKLKNK